MANWDILLLDKSASMISSKNEMIKGFNELVREQKSQNSTNLFTVITFNQEVEILKEETFPNVKEIEGADIMLKGSTALLDAVGTAYDMILKNEKYTDINMTIITDGLENSSNIYTFDLLDSKKEMIDKKYKLNIVFIGADISCINKNAVNRHATQSVDYSGDIQEALRIASRSMSSQREGSNYVPKGLVENNTVTPLIMKRSASHLNETPPRVKRCKTFCDP